MYEGKVQRVQIGMEPKYITGDSETRLYMSKVCSQAKKKRKATGMYLLQIILALLIAICIGVIAIQYAYMERGYWAFGGEYLLIFYTFIVTYWLLNRNL